MQQLIMYWNHDGTPAQPLSFPEGYSLLTLPELPDGVEQWLDMVQYGLSEKREDASYYKDHMIAKPCYREDQCFFIAHNGKAIATVTVICDPEAKDGLVHMVCCLPECRGKGVGNMLCAVAEHTLKEAGMQTAWLKTDDFRIPAIKGYLKIGFRPDTSTQDYKDRWNAIYQTIGFEE